MVTASPAPADITENPCCGHEVPKFRTRISGKVDCKWNTKIIIGKQKILSCKHGNPLILFPLPIHQQIIPNDSIPEIYRFHQPFQMSHLSRTLMVHGILPVILRSVSNSFGLLCIELHHGIIAIGMSAGACKHRPVSIAPHILSRPVRLCLIVQSLKDSLIRRFPVQRRLIAQFPVPQNISPAVFPEKTILYRIIIPASQRTLIIPPVTRLEHIEVKPLCIRKPHGGRTSSKRMKTDQLIMSLLPQNGGKGIINGAIRRCLNVPSQKPYDVFPISIPFRQKSSIPLNVLIVYNTPLDQASPGRQQRHIHTQFLRHIDHPVTVLPIRQAAVVTILYRHFIDVAQFRRSIHQHRLYYIKAFCGTVFQIIVRLLLF